MDTMSWDEYFMTLAFFVSMKSKDPSTRVGAVIVAPDHEIVATGFNGLCRGVADNLSLTDRYDRQKLKYLVTEHAERNALYQAARLGAHTLGCSLYTQGLPCCDCARGIIQAGIREVIVSSFWEKMADKKWQDQSSITEMMFSEANVKLRIFEGPYKNATISGLFNGKRFNLNEC